MGTPLLGFLNKGWNWGKGCFFCRGKGEKSSSCPWKRHGRLCRQVKIFLCIHDISEHLQMSFGCQFKQVDWKGDVIFVPRRRTWALWNDGSGRTITDLLIKLFCDLFWGDQWLADLCCVSVYGFPPIFLKCVLAEDGSDACGEFEAALSELMRLTTTSA